MFTSKQKKNEIKHQKLQVHSLLYYMYTRLIKPRKATCQLIITSYAHVSHAHTCTPKEVKRERRGLELEFEQWRVEQADMAKSAAMLSAQREMTARQSTKVLQNRKTNFWRLHRTLTFVVPHA